VELGGDLKLLVFDLDGTLVHLDVDWDAVRTRLDLGTGRIGDAIQGWVLAGDEAPLAAVTEAELAGLGERTVTADVAAALDRLAARCPLAVLTRNSRLVAERALGPLADRVTIVGREDVQRLKPDPEGLQVLLARHGVAPGDAALVGDTFHDVAAAHAAGLRSIVVHNERLAFRPDGADLYVERIDDLPALLT
jgi:HAD superfamily hydrolase (TIGR01509 family)